EIFSTAIGCTNPTAKAEPNTTPAILIRPRSSTPKPLNNPAMSPRSMKARRTIVRYDIGSSGRTEIETKYHFFTPSVILTVAVPFYTYARFRAGGTDILIASITERYNPRL